MNIKKTVAISAAVGVVLAGIAFAAPANADPISNSYVLAGSDTLQDSSNALANGSSISGSYVHVTAGTSTIGSFDAFGSSTIQTKTDGTYFGRPAGSGAGLAALSRSIDGAAFSTNGGNNGPTITTSSILGQVDIARSSSGANAAGSASGVQDANGALEFIPYARDAVAYAYKLGAGVTAPAGIDSLTTAQLTQIYNGSTTAIGGVAVDPILPQVGSGTRKFFVKAINLTDSTVTGVTNNSAAENDARALAPTAGEIQIVPFSAASWIAQSNGATGVNTITGTNAILGSPNGLAPFTGTGSNLVPSSAFYSAAPFGRDTYMVVEFARIDPSNAKYDANLANLVDPSKSKSLTYFPTTAVSPSSSAAVKKKFGFLAPSNPTPFRTTLFN